MYRATLITPTKITIHRLFNLQLVYRERPFCNKYVLLAVYGRGNAFPCKEGTSHFKWGSAILQPHESPSHLNFVQVENKWWAEFNEPPLYKRNSISHLSDEKVQMQALTNKVWALQYQGTLQRSDGTGAGLPWAVVLTDPLHTEGAPGCRLL